MTTWKAPVTPARLTALGAILLTALAGCQDNPSPIEPLLVGPSMAVMEQTPGTPLVNSLADPGDGLCDDTECTLREAILLVTEGGEIGFSPELTGTIVLNGANLSIPRSMTIRGPGAEILAVSGNTTHRVFAVWEGSEATRRPVVEIHGLTVRDGNSDPYGGFGGGIYMNDSDLSLVGVVVRDNVSFEGIDYSRGGGIHAKGNLSLTDCLVTGNTASSGGGIVHMQDSGGIGSLSLTRTTVAGNTAFGASGGGVAFESDGNSGTIVGSTIAGNKAKYHGGLSIGFGARLAITNSTVSGNYAEVGGGGIANDGQLTLTNVTIADNSTGGWGGGIWQWEEAGSLLLRNSLVASNVAPLDQGPDIFLEGGTVTASYSLIGDSGGHSLIDGVDNNIVGVSQVLLGDLADNGGPTLTRALLEGSPAIDAGSCTDAAGTTTITTDQRGESRPQGGYCDIGAFEWGGTDLQTPTFTFDLSSLPATIYGDPAFSVVGYTGTNSSGAITFALGAGSVGCSVTSAGQVTVTGVAVGTDYCVLTAYLASDDTYRGAGPISQSFQIAQASLTVTANDVTIAYGVTPVFGVTYDGFVQTDDEGSLGGTLGYIFTGTGSTTYGPSPTPPTAIGTYSLLPTGLTSANYAITYRPGTFTINKAAGSVSINNIPAGAMEGGSFTPTYSQLGDGVASTASLTEAVCKVTDGTVTFLSGGGDCQLQASVEEGTNYLAATGSEQTFTVSLAPVFSSVCTYTVSPKSDLRKTITVTWENADPGVTLIEVYNGRTVSKAMAPTASGSWSTGLRTESASLGYQLFGGVDRKDRATVLASGTCEGVTP